MKLILMLSLAITTLNAQDLLIQKKYADSLFKAEKYFDAITEYKRLIFFDSLESYSFYGNFFIGKCYKAGGKYNEAINYFTKAIMYTADTQSKYTAKIEIVKSNLLRRTPERALQILNEMENSYDFNGKKDSLSYWRAWAYIFNDDWVKGKYYFEKFQFQHELAVLSSRVIKEKYSVTFAKLISYIVPGAGQIYTGNIVSGLMSFAYNFLFGFLTVKAFSEDRFIDGALIGGLLWLRFYRGNVQNSERFVKEKNDLITKKALDYLQNEYKGDKP